MNKLMAADIERQAGVMWGYNPKEAKRRKTQRKMAEIWLADPLFGFPNDIIYMTKQQVQQKLAFNRRFGKRIAEASRWDVERAEACLGRHGIVARRCSMNDKLWMIFKAAKRRNVTLSLAGVRKMINLDIKRSKLYPSGWQNDRMPPPQEWLDKLRAEGKLGGILKEIEEASK